MSINTRIIKPVNRLDKQDNNSAQKKLKLPQVVTIAVLIFFNTGLLELFPFQIGPLTQTMLMELIAFVAIFPSLRIYTRNLGTRDKNLFFIGVFMFALSIINLSGDKGWSQQKTIFTSMYAYFFIVCFFSGIPEHGIWLRRFHLIPALAIIFMIGMDVGTTYGGINLDVRIRDNEAASYLAIIIPICWVQFQRERGFFRLLNISVIGATPFVLLLTASRTAFVVLLIVIILTMIVEKPAKRVIIVVAILLITLSLVYLLPEQSVFLSRISSLGDPISELQVDRVALWKAAILSIRENPLFGGDFRTNVFRLVLEAAPESNYARHIIINTAGGQFGVHNGYLAVMVNFGIPVAFLYFIFFFSLGKALLHVRRRIRDDANRRLLSAGFITLIGYTVASITLHFYIGQNFFIIWAMLQCTINNSLIEESIEA